MNSCISQIYNMVIISKEFKPPGMPYGNDIHLIVHSHHRCETMNTKILSLNKTVYHLGCLVIFETHNTVT